MKSGALILTITVAAMITASILANRAEKKKCGCEPNTIFNTPIKEIFEIN